MRLILVIVLNLIFFISSASCNDKGENEKAGNSNNIDIAEQTTDAKFSLKEKWEAVGLKVPESVFYHKESDILFVSNINGSPSQKNGEGFISKLSTEGEIITLKWIEGLNAPKGMGVKGNLLYVTDIDRLVEIDIKKGEIQNEYPAEGARFLNDIAIDEEGTVYITDNAANRIYRFKDGKIEKWKDIPAPNGIRYFNYKIYAGNFSNGEIYEITPESGNFKIIRKIGTGIDGLIILDDGSFITSDWNGRITFVPKDEEPYVLIDTDNRKINAADIEYIPEKKLLLVPTFYNHRVVAYELIN